MKGISISKFLDGMMILHVKIKEIDFEKDKNEYEKGDLILRDNENHIEFLTRLMKIINRKNDINNFLKIIDQSLETDTNNASKKVPASGSNEYL